MRRPSRDCNDVEPSNTLIPPAAAVAEPTDGVPDDSQLLTHDPTLTAFAQLGAFRLNCQRSFISLMDRDNQYILAEATRSVSLVSPAVCDQGDEVYLGARVLDMLWGVCPNTIQVFTAKDGSCNVSSENVTANPACYVMNDMAAIEQFKDRPYIAGWPYMRFYAEVPIHSPTGHVIGTFCVVDNKPRDRLDSRGLDALNEISAAIMQHLELVQTKHNLQRPGGMIKGLGKFVEGKGRVARSSEEQPDRLEDLLRAPPTARGGTSESSSSSIIQQGSSSTSTDITTISSISAPLVNRTAGGSVRRGPEPPSSRVPVPFAKPRTADERRKSLPYPALQRELNGESSSVGTKQLFSNASHLIREAIDLDGLIFVDARFRDIAIDPSSPTLLSPSSASSRYRGTPNTPLGDQSGWLDSSKDAAGLVDRDALLGSRFVPSRPNPNGRSSSDVLGYSVRTSPGANISLSSATQVLLPQSTLRGLLETYPDGHTFIFDDDGSLVHIEDDLLPHSAEKPVLSDSSDMEDIWANQLRGVCSDAKSIVFFPLVGSSAKPVVCWRPDVDQGRRQDNRLSRLDLPNSIWKLHHV